jgi:WD repeat-containing protein 48
MANPTTIHRRVSYILPAPSEPPQYLSLPSLDQPRRGHPSPFFIPKNGQSRNGSGDFQSRNPFLSPDEVDESAPAPAQPKQNQPKHCLGVTSLALDTSTLLENNQSPGGILYSGARDGLVCSWELNVPHKRRRGGRYEIQPGRGSRVKWEKVGDGAEFFEEDEDDYDDEDGSGERDRDSSDDEDEAAVNGKPRGEVPYEDRWEVDAEAIAQAKVSSSIDIADSSPARRRSASPLKRIPTGSTLSSSVISIKPSSQPRPIVLSAPGLHTPQAMRKGYPPRSSVPTGTMSDVWPGPSTPACSSLDHSIGD